MARSTTTERAPGTAVAPPRTTLPAELADEFLQDVQSRQQFDSDDLAIPFLKVLQGLSPQCTEGEPEYREDARPGMLFHTVTSELYNGKEGVLLIPCFYTRNFTEWKLRRDGGGFVRDYGADGRIKDQTTRNDDGRDVLPNGHEIIESALYYCIMVAPNGNHQQVVVSLTRTQLKKGRRWNSLMSSLLVEHPKEPGRKVQPPMHYMAYRATTVPESNDEGNWHGWVFTAEGPTVELQDGLDLYRAARDFRQLAVEGQVQVRLDQMQDGPRTDEVPEGEATEVRAPQAAQPPAGDGPPPLDDDDLPF